MAVSGGVATTAEATARNKLATTVLRVYVCIGIREMPRCPTIAELLRTLAFKRSCAAAIVECAVVGAALHNAVHSWSINSSAKHQHVSRLGAHHQVLLVDRAFDSAGLVRAFEMAFNIGAIL